MDGVHVSRLPHTACQIFAKSLRNSCVRSPRFALGGSTTRLVPFLIEVKNRYDPDDVFKFAQSIPLSLKPKKSGWF
jgi:hypothetical protein